MSFVVSNAAIGGREDGGKGRDWDDVLGCHLKALLAVYGGSSVQI